MWIASSTLRKACYRSADSEGAFHPDRVSDTKRYVARPSWIRREGEQHPHGVCANQNGQVVRSLNERSILKSLHDGVELRIQEIRTVTGKRCGAGRQH